MTETDYRGHEVRAGLKYWLRLSGAVAALDALAFLGFEDDSRHTAYAYALGFMPPFAWGLLFSVQAVGVVYVLHCKPRDWPLRLLLLSQFVAYGLFAISILRTSLEGDLIAALPGFNKWGAMAVSAAWMLGHPFYAKTFKALKGEEG